MAKRKNRELLMLAYTFDAKKHRVGGWFLSEKLDGQRAFWDGGISRGMPKEEVPWANLVGDYRLVSKEISTGLWSRYGNVIHAPDWWLDQLPRMMLDGELWIGPNTRQELTSVIKQLVPDGRWRRVKYYIFDLPPWRSVFQDGRINNTNYQKVFKDFHNWKSFEKLEKVLDPFTRFESALKLIQQLDGEIALPLAQERLPFQTDKALARMEEMLEIITQCGGEGVMLRKPESRWEPIRTTNCLKVKKLDDAEGTVMSYITGRETDKGSKLLGMLGALVLRYDGPKGTRRLELSGFTDNERQFHNKEATEWAINHPGQEVPCWIESIVFPRGMEVTFKFRGHTRDGVPCEARYWRIHQS